MAPEPVFVPSKVAAMLKTQRIILSSTKYLLSHCCSSFVSKTRYMNRLKQDDKECLSALQNGCIFLFHRLRPLLHPPDRGTYTPATLRTSDVLTLLETLGSDGSLLKESVLISCSEQNQAQFCLDVGELDQAAVEDHCEGTFQDLRKSLFQLSEAEALLLSKGQALLHWHQTSRFCSATGQLTHRNQAGSQRVCSTNGMVYYPQQEPGWFISRTGFTMSKPGNPSRDLVKRLNKMFPVVIVLVSDGNRCLLGRQSSFPQGMFTALAGFCDLGESLEEALCREVAEEVGLEVQSFSYSSSQHWPFPHSSFMLGCHASVSPAHTQLQVDHTELEDARWFTLEEITCALQVKTPPRRGDPTVLWLPPKQTIAHHLIVEWVERQLK